MIDPSHFHDALWKLFAGILVLLMQAGFLLLEAGRVRERNVVSVAQKNATDLALCWVIFITVGFSIGFGVESPLFNTGGTLADVAEFVFQLGFCGAAATIVSGAVAERCRFEAYLLITLCVAGAFYPISVRLVWGDALVADRFAALAAINFIDFAGGTVVHAMAGATGLAAAIVLGPRLGRFNKDGSANELVGHSPVLQLFGTLILLIGWIGFNGGAVSLEDNRFATTIINTLSAASFGAVVGMLYGYLRDGRVFNPNRTINGLLAGLVAVTAGAPYATVFQVAALVVVAVLVVSWLSDWLPARFQLDDPLDVFAVHGVSGAIGTVAVALLIPESLLVAGRGQQLLVQAAGALGIMLAVFSLTWVLLRLVNRFFPIRVPPESERLGLNYTEHGVRLDSELLQQSIRTSIADAGGFDSELETLQYMPAEQSELANALSELLGKHQQARATISRQAERFQHFAATTNDLLWETDERGYLATLQFNNDVIQQQDIDELLNKFFFNCFETGEIERADTQYRVINRQPLSRVEVSCYLTHSKRSLNLQVSGVPYYDEAGQFKGYRGGATDITNQKLAEDHASFLANHDQLTGLKNRRSLAVKSSAIDLRSCSAVAVIDLDGFGALNAEHGHQVGDELLIVAAKIINRVKRDSDNVFRIGADEFMVVLGNLREPEARDDARQWGERLIKDLSQPMIFSGKSIHISASIGISFYPDDAENLDDLMHLANVALSQAKSAGPAQLVIFDPDMLAIARQHRQLRTELERALEKREFFLTYQPKLNLAERSLVGFEALVRWRHPERGVLSPGEFISTIETMGCMEQLGLQVLEEACATAVNWPMREVYVAVNVAPVQLNNAGFVDDVQAILEKTGFPASRLELELTEESLVTGYKKTRGILKRLRAMGISIAIDDFGCGSTSLQYLYRLPVDKLKIDQSFVRNLVNNDRALEITRSIVHLAKELDLVVTAEGVDDEAQIPPLQQWQCDEIQGYLISKPIEAKEVIARWSDAAKQQGQRQ